jgi:hypothetical protein
MSHDDARAHLGRLLLRLHEVQETTSELIHDLHGVYCTGRLSLQLQSVSEGVVESEPKLQSTGGIETGRPGKGLQIRICTGV